MLIVGDQLPQFSKETEPKEYFQALVPVIIGTLLASSKSAGQACRLQTQPGVGAATSREAELLP